VHTFESVTCGHPDKLCDQISDAVLDAALAKDRDARVACEALCSAGMVLVAGEISASCHTDIPAIARRVIREAGYDRPEYGFDASTCSVLVATGGQSPDIARGVECAFDAAGESGAGDQGMMFGFACDETPELMPAPIPLAHALVRRLAEARTSGELPWLRPDGKAQVSVEYDGAGRPARIAVIVVSAQHGEDVGIAELRDAVTETVIGPVIPSGLLGRGTRIYINPTGRFVCGGPAADTGLTGRKIISDAYGGCAPHGGGAFSGKDPTKVDRSAAYMARYVAKNIVAAGLARRCLVEVAYAIGVSRPVSVLVDTQKTGIISDRRLSEIVAECFDFRPMKIIEALDLRRPIYRQTATYGHFGRTDLNLPWERTDMTEALKASI
jgi:S-adenosylmethionine synthetase